MQGGALEQRTNENEISKIFIHYQSCSLSICISLTMKSAAATSLPWTYIL